MFIVAFMRVFILVKASFASTSTNGIARYFPVLLA